MKTNFWSLVDSYKSIVTILALAAVLRLWNLANVPPALTPDEAALGYNAYSILNTGRDEHGEFMPVIYSSFGDYKPGLYVYASVPFVALFGLNEWSVRLPSALAGIVTVFLIYLIVKILIIKNSLKIKTLKLEIIVAFVAATSPWLIHLSRGAWETNLSLTLTLAGVYFFLRSIHTSYFLLHTSVAFAATFLTYQGAKLSTTIVMLVLAISYWNDIRTWLLNEKYHLIKSALVGLIIVIPVLLSFFLGRTGRLEVNSVFSYPRPQEYTTQFLDKANEKLNDLNYYLYHSEVLNFSRGILGRWFNHYSGAFLFFEGDYQNPRHSSPNHGMLLLIDLLLLPLGFIYIIRSKKLDTRFKKFVVLWLILAPLPSALSRDQVHAVRSINLDIPLVVLSGFGFYYLLVIINKLKAKYFLPTKLAKLCLYSIFTILYSGSILYFLDSYFIHLPIHNARYWYYGYKESVQKVLSLQNDYEKVIFQQSYSQPYIYFLFFGQYDPKSFQNKTRFVGNGADVSLLGKLDKIEFQTFSWPPGVGKEKTLIVGDSVAIPDNFSRIDFNLIEDIKYPDGITTAFRIIEKKKNL